MEQFYNQRANNIKFESIISQSPTRPPRILYNYYDNPLSDPYAIAIVQEEEAEDDGHKEDELKVKDSFRRASHDDS